MAVSSFGKCRDFKFVDFIKISSHTTAPLKHFQNFQESNFLEHLGVAGP